MILSTQGDIYISSVAPAASQTGAMLREKEGEEREIERRPREKKRGIERRRGMDGGVNTQSGGKTTLISGP